MPLTTWVPRKTQLVRTASGVPGASDDSVDFCTGMASPVSADSSTTRPSAEMRRHSPGTTSPADRCRSSPARTSASTRVGVSPCRSTSTVDETLERSSCTSRETRNSWVKPCPAFANTMMPMMMPSVASPTAVATVAAIMRMSVTGERNCLYASAGQDSRRGAGPSVRGGAVIACTRPRGALQNSACAGAHSGRSPRRGCGQ